MGRPGADVICSLEFPWPAENGEIRHHNTVITPRDHENEVSKNPVWTHVWTVDWEMQENAIPVSLLVVKCTR